MEAQRVSGKHLFKPIKQNINSNEINNHINNNNNNLEKKKLGCDLILFSLVLV